MSKTTQDSPPAAAPEKGGTSGAGAASLAARLWTVAIGLMLCAAGLGTCWFLWAAWQQARETDSWVETPCTIIAAALDDSQLSQHGMIKYELKVAYRYEFGGESRVSNRIRRLPVVSTSEGEIEDDLAEYPVGLETTCLVNPEDPDQAVLKPETKAPLYTMWFPGLFVVGGIGIMIAGVRGRRG